MTASTVPPRHVRRARTLRRRTLGMVCLVGVTVLGLTTWSAYDIERSLRREAQAALATSGSAGQVYVEGRDARVSGAAADRDGLARAAAVVAGVPGIRVVETDGRAAAPWATTPQPSATGTQTGQDPQVVPSPGKPTVGTTEPLKRRTLLRFASDEALLNASARARLDGVAAYLLEHPTVRVRVQGFTDDTGTDEGNLDLARRRALAAARYLSASGVPATRCVIESYGASRPLADNRTSQGRAENRRVELVFERVA